MSERVVSGVLAHSRARRQLAVCVLAAAVLAGGAPPAQGWHSRPENADIEVTTGYFPVGEPDASGTREQLAFELARLRNVSGLPTLMMYSGYTHLLGGGIVPFVKRGYAVVGVSPRGTGCSSGRWDFMSDQEASDASEVINWIAAQDWSDGKVAMIGASFVGWQQLGVASRVPRPKPLVAIAPASPIADIYRDLAYPGGIPNTAVGAGIKVVLTSTLRANLAQGNEENRLRCLANQADHADQTGSAAALFAAHPYDEGEMHKRSLIYGEDISLPTLAFVAWQDGVLGSRAIDSLSAISGPLHAVLTNGDHSSSCSPRFRKELGAFLDFYVKGIDNGYGDRSRIQVWWETQRSNPGTTYDAIAECVDGVVKKDDSPRWTSELPRFPPPQIKSEEFFLSGNSSLSPMPGKGSPDTYAYVGGSGQYRGCDGFPQVDHIRQPDPDEPTPPDWSGPPDADKSLVYTSPPLDKDMVAFGSGSLDLWLESSFVDTDVQAVLTEVRSDGQEVYVQAGWLRASHRAENLMLKTATRPYHTHQSADADLLEPGAPALMRLEIRPFGHVFRKGSQVRIWVEAPARRFGCWALGSLPGPAINKVHHDGERQSVLRLATLPGHAAPAAYPACGSVVRQACRPDPLP